MAAPRLGRSSFDLRHEATVGGRLTCTGLVTYVPVVPGQNTACPIPDRVRRRLEAAA